MAVVSGLLVVTWLLLSPSSDTSLGLIGPNGEASSGTPSAQHQGPTDQMQRCIDANKAIELTLHRGASSIDQWVSGCATTVLSSSPPPLFPAPLVLEPPFTS